MRKINSTFQTKFISEEGSKVLNKDYFAFVELDKFGCYVLVDGIDEDPNKKSSELVAKSLIRHFTEKPTFRKKALQAYIKEAHEILKKESSDMHLKATVTMVVTDYSKVRYTQVGNTRFYLFRNGRIAQKSIDQSLAQVLLESGEVAQDKIAQHEERHNLYSYLGQEGVLQPFVSSKIKLEDGDIWILLTRGIWEQCNEGELIDATDEAKEVQEVIDGIEDLILSKQPQEIDNYTLAVTFIDKTYKNPKKKVTVKRIIMTLIPILLISTMVGGGLYLNYRKKQNQRVEMNDYITSAQKYIANNNYTKANEDYAEAMRLAKKLKLTEEKEIIDHYRKLLDQIIVGDGKLKDGQYAEAQETYLMAKQLVPMADGIGEAYIEEKLSKTKDYLNVLDLLQEGDKQLDYGEVENAREAYQEAKILANNCYFQEGKKEAISKIDKIDNQKAIEKKEEEAKQKEEEKQLEEEEKKLEAEKKLEEELQKEAEIKRKEEAAKSLEMKLSAMEIEKKANISYNIGSYEDAKMYYLMAKEMYLEGELFERVEALEEKIIITEKKITELQSKKVKANGYVEEADEKVVAEFYTEAKVLYLIAQDIYKDAGLEEDVIKVKKKIALIEELMN